VTTELPALQAALAAEHAVIWGYGVVGARLTGPELAAVAKADKAHRDRRDAVADLVRQRGGDPVAAEAAYRPPFEVRDRTTALRLGAYLEDGAAAAWRYVVGSAEAAALRETAVDALLDTATRATRWRLLVDPAHAAAAFPGTPS